MVNVATDHIGVILINLGTPDAPTAPAIRKYLAEFLSDPRVVGLPRSLWLPILYGFILPFRPSKLVKKYAEIWGKTDAPIREYMHSLAIKSEQALVKVESKQTIIVRAAMTYGNPTLKGVIDELGSQGIDDMIILPLFPQYSAATTAATFDKLARGLRQKKQLPNIRFITQYFDRPAYIHAITKSIGSTAPHIADNVKLVFSFHGLPKAQIEAGDPYADQCHCTAELIASSLGLTKDQWLVTFQSRFGPAQWLQPYTSDVMARLPKVGTSKVLMVCPGFAVDCLETLAEIQGENQAIFLAAGGKQFTYISALNDNLLQVELVKDLILSHLYHTHG